MIKHRYGTFTTVVLLAISTIATPSATRAQQEPAAARTQETEPAEPESPIEHLGEPTGPVDSASVKFDGRVLFAVRGIPGFDAGERVNAIEDRLRAVARDREFDLSNLRTSESELGTEILAGNRRLAVITDLDAELVGGLRRSALAAAYVSRVQDVMQQYRTDREPRVVLTRGLYALGATVVLALVLLMLRWLFRKSLALQERHRAKLRGLSLKSAQLVRAEQIRSLVAGALRWGFGLAALTVIYAYLNGVLGLFPWTSDIARDLLGYVLHPLRTIVLGFIGYLPNLIFIVILVLVTRLLLKGIRVFLSGVAQGTVQLHGFDPDWAWPTYRLLRILVIAFLVVVAYPYIPGSGSDAFKGVSIFLGVIFSLGSSSVIGNVIAGYSMTYRRTFKVGDRVQIGDLIGDVTQVRLLVTHLRSPKNEEIVVPNSLIIGSNVINYSSVARKEGLILHTSVGIGYEVPWRQVEAMLLEAAERTEDLLREPAPFVLQKALGDFCVTYELNAHCQDPHRMYELYTSLHRNIQDVFNEYEIQIMTPAYVADPDEAKVVPKDRWFEAPAAEPAGGARDGSPPVTPRASGQPA